MANRRPGRPSKGPRQDRTVRLPLSLDRGVADVAASSGIAMNDVITIAIREHLARLGQLPDDDDEAKLIA